MKEAFIETLRGLKDITTELYSYVYNFWVIGKTYKKVSLILSLIFGFLLSGLFASALDCNTELLQLGSVSFVVFIVSSIVIYLIFIKIQDLPSRPKLFTRENMEFVVIAITLFILTISISIIVIGFFGLIWKLILCW